MGEFPPQEEPFGYRSGPGSEYQSPAHCYMPTIRAIAMA